MVHVGLIGARKDNPGFFEMFTTAIYMYIYIYGALLDFRRLRS